MKRLLSIVIVVAVVIGATFGYIQYLKWKAEKAIAKVAHLAPEAAAYIALAKIAGESQDAPSKPVAKPAVVAVTAPGRKSVGNTRKTGNIDPITGELPDDLFPVSPEEVGTVIALLWQGELVGKYENKASAYQETCLAKVIDRATGALLEEKYFEGGDPPETVSDKKKVAWGSSCEDEVREYIESLFEG